jgi:hypothetical protein
MLTLGLATIFYCLRFETSLFVASYDSQGLMLRSTVSRPVCLGIKHPSVAYDQIFITVGQLRVCWYRALSLTRGRVCRLQLLLGLASAVILGSEPLGTHDRILLYQIWDFPFRRLLRLAGSRWRYSTPPPHGYPHGVDCVDTNRIENTKSNSSILCYSLLGNVFI